MNHRRPWWIVFSLLPLLIGLCALVVPFGCGSGNTSTPTPVPTNANVALAFVGTGPVGNFQSILLNISGVRINKLVDAATNSPGWTTIAVPPQAGSGNGQNPGDLQIDLLHTQTAATIYNVAGAPPGEYNTVQVLVDSTNPGTVVPACQSGNSNTEGCTNYKMQFLGNNLVPVLVSLATPLSVVKNAVAPLVIALDVSILQAPATTGDPYTVSVIASETNAGSFLATVSGSVTTQGSPPQHTVPLTVSAELSGTNNVIETTPVGGAKFTLELPAAPTGTSYDIFTNGGAVTYGALQGITVTPGQFLGGQNMTVSAATPAGLLGFIADNCHAFGIAGAQLQLLAPAANVTTLPTPRPTPPVSFCVDNPQQCVIVASANADQGGNYPIPGTKKFPADFSQIPVGEKDLAVQINASGYTSLISSAFVKSSSNGLCSSATSTTMCNFSLTTGYINGTVNLVSDPPPNSSVVVQVFAENSGTNQLVSALSQPLVFLNHQNSLPFQLNVPINPPVNGASPPFDLFAVAIDPFQGAPNPYTGHDIPVLANQPAPAAGCVQATASPFLPMDCVGHGSITGAAQNPDQGTSVEVEKVDPTQSSLVQILGTTPALFSSISPTNNEYTLCVPPDDYVLQRFQTDPFVPGSPTPSPTPVGSPQSIRVPAPAATSSPCPSTCSNGDTATSPCPGLCSATLASPL